MSSNDPRPTSDLDESLRRVAHQASLLQRVALLGIAVVVLALVAVVIVLIFRTMADERRIDSSCSFWREVGVLPVEAHQLGNIPQTSKLGVTLILGARESYIGQDCGRELPPASPGLKYLEKLYHV